MGIFFVVSHRENCQEFACFLSNSFFFFLSTIFKKKFYKTINIKNSLFYPSIVLYFFFIAHARGESAKDLRLRRAVRESVRSGLKCGKLGVRARKKKNRTGDAHCSYAFIFRYLNTNIFSRLDRFDQCPRFFLCVGSLFFRPPSIFFRKSIFVAFASANNQLLSHSIYIVSRCVFYCAR